MVNIVTDFSGWMRSIEKRVGFLERRPGATGLGAVTVSTAAELAALLAASRPTPSNPLVVLMTGELAPTRFMVSADGVMWQQMTPAPAPYIEPTLTAPWANYRQGQHKVGYLKTSAGIVSITGLIAGGSTSSVPFTLPVGYRPDHDRFYPVIAGGGAGVVRITAAGAVTVTAGAGVSSFTALGAIMFPAAGVATWTPVTSFASGWASYHTIDPAFGVLSYWRDPLGRVWFDGMPRQTTPGTIGALTTMFTIPVRKRLVSHYPALGNGSFSTVIVSDNGTVAEVRAHMGTATNWVSLNRAEFVDNTVRPTWERNEAFYLNSWVKYPDAQYPDRVFMAFADGLCFQDGLIANGTTIGSSNTAMSTFGVPGALPDVQIAQNNFRSGMEIFTTTSNLAIGRSDCVGVGPLTQTTGDKAWMEQTGSTLWRSYGGVNYVIGA